MMYRTYACISTLLLSVVIHAGEICLKNSTSSLLLSKKNGAIRALNSSDGSACLLSAEEAFTLQLLDKEGEPTRYKSSDFVFSHDEDNLKWHHANGLYVCMKVEAAGSEFKFTPTVKGIPSGMLLEWFDGPQVCVSSDKTLYWPYWDGCEVTDYNCRKYHPCGYRKRFSTLIGSLYPGFCQMQFLAAYRDGKGVYFSAVDSRHTPKGVEWERLDDKTVRLSLQTFCGDLEKDGTWQPSFYYSLRTYSGGWMEACEIYRNWVRTLPGFDKSPDRPQWMYDSPVNLIYPIRGTGKDNSPTDMPANCYFPYTNALSSVEKYGRMLDSKVMPLLMHWEGTAPWAPPYVWPPYGGEEELRKFRDELHKRGDVLGVYCSGTAWTQISTIIPSYSLERRFEEERLARHMMRGPKGEITAFICNPEQRYGYDMCLADDWCINTLENEVAKMSQFGIDYCQFFDQNLGGGWLLCYAKNHGHPPIPGAWATDVMLSLQKRIAYKAGNMLLGCEAAAATPYVTNLFYNDSRPMIDLMLFGKPVPGVAFVFHEWMCNFSGNMCGIDNCDPFWRWTYCFTQGDMLSLILGADGELTSAWCRSWDKKFPEQDELIPFVRKLNDIRKKHSSFLLEGRMIRPFVKCSSKPITLNFTGWENGSVETSEILVSFWENASGEKIGFATNWRRESSTLNLTYNDGKTKSRILAPLETIEFSVE